MSDQTGKEAERFPALLADKKRKAGNLQKQIEDLTNQLDNLKTEIKYAHF